MLNKVMLIGRLGADPEVRYMPNGEAVTNIRLATSRRWKDRQSGENKEVTEWHRVVFFNQGNYRLAEIAGEYLKKGSQVYVEGRIQTRKWQDKDGKDQYTTEIYGEQMQMLDSKTGGTDSFGDSQNTYNAQSAYQQPSAQFNPPPQQTFQPPQQPVYQQPQQGFSPPPTQPFNQGQQYTPPPMNRPPVQPAAPAYDDYDDDIPF